MQSKQKRIGLHGSVKDDKASARTVHISDAPL
jgi:hypothetical protein